MLQAIAQYISNTHTDKPNVEDLLLDHCKLHMYYEQVKINWQAIADSIDMKREKIYHWYTETFVRNLLYTKMTDSDKAIIRKEITTALMQGVPINKAFRKDLEAKLHSKYHRFDFTSTVNNIIRSKQVRELIAEHKIKIANLKQSRCTDSRPKAIGVLKCKSSRRTRATPRKSGPPALLKNSGSPAPQEAVEPSVRLDIPQFSWSQEGGPALAQPWMISPDDQFGQPSLHMQYPLAGISVSGLPLQYGSILPLQPQASSLHQNPCAPLSTARQFSPPGYPPLAMSCSSCPLVSPDPLATVSQQQPFSSVVSVPPSSCNSYSTLCARSGGLSHSASYKSLDQACNGYSAGAQPQQRYYCNKPVYIPSPLAEKNAPWEFGADLAQSAVVDTSFLYGQHPLDEDFRSDAQCYDSLRFSDSLSNETTIRSWRIQSLPHTLTSDLVIRPISEKPGTPVTDTSSSFNFESIYTGLSARCLTTELCSGAQVVPIATAASGGDTPQAHENNVMVTEVRGHLSTLLQNSTSD